MVVEISDKNFKELLNEGKPMMVDFSATWCGPCGKVAPIVEELSEVYAGKINMGKCDVDNGDDIVTEFSIRNIPTLLFFKNGELVDKYVGTISKENLAKKLDAIL